MFIFGNEQKCEYMYSTVYVKVQNGISDYTAAKAKIFHLWMELARVPRY
jgi:hypothetical protein